MQKQNDGEPIDQSNDSGFDWPTILRMVNLGVKLVKRT
jgi:hypothetical protein